MTHDAITSAKLNMCHIFASHLKADSLGDLPSSVAQDNKRL